MKVAIDHLETMGLYELLSPAYYWVQWIYSSSLPVLANVLYLYRSTGSNDITSDQTISYLIPDMEGALNGLLLS